MGRVMLELVGALRGRFRRVTSFKPKSSRAESKETFYVGLGFTGHPPPASGVTEEQQAHAAQPA